MMQIGSFVVQYKQLMSRKLSVISSQNSKVRSGRLISPLHRVQSSVCLTFLVTHQLLAHHASLALLHSFSFVGKFIDVLHMRGCCCWKIKRSTQVRILLTRHQRHVSLTSKYVLYQIQGGRQEFEIGVAYNLGQKCLNQDIFGIEGQMFMFRWPEVQMTRSSNDQESK